MKFAPYTSGRLKQLKVGITSYSEEKTPFEVVGSVSVGGSITVNKSITVNNISITSTTSVSEFSNLNISGVSTFNDNAFFNSNVAIGTDNVNAPVGVSNTSILAVGILTANRIYSTVYGEFTGGSVVAGSIVGTALSISGISTFGGNVGIGTTDPTKAVGAGNTAILAVGILTANRIYSTVYGEFTGGSVVAGSIVGTALSISGISTLGTVQVSSGIISATSGVVTYFGDGSNLTGTGNTTNVRTDSLVVSGVSTFSDLVDVNAELNTQGGRIVGAATSNVIPFLYANYSDLPNASTYHGAFAHVHATGRAYYAHAGNWFELVNKEADGTVGTGTERYNIGPVDTTSLDVSGISTFSTVDIDGNLDVDGYSRFDGIKIDEGGLVIVSGVSTISSDVLLDTANSQNIVFSRGGNSIKFGDNTKALFGNSSDLQIYHGVVGVSGTSYIDNNTGALYIRNNVDDDDGGNIIIEAKAGKASAVFQDDEGVRLYYDDAEKIATTGYGVTVNGTTQTQQLNVSGISTLANTVVGGATTELLVTGDARVTGEFKVGDGTIVLNSTGVSTFPTSVNIGPVSISSVTASNFPLDVNIGGNLTVGSGITIFSSTGIVSAVSYRGDGSELVGVAKSSVLEDNGINPIGVSTFNNLDVTGVTTIAGNLVANGNIIGDNATNISGINSVTATSFFGDGSGLENVGVDTGIINTDSLKVSGISTFTGNIDANGQLDVDGLTSLDDLVITGFATFSNTLKVGSTLDVDGAADIAGHLELGSSVNIAGVTTIAGDITVGGNITGDGSTVISGVTSVIATKFYGNGENLTGINADTIGDLDHLKVTGLSTFVGNAQFDGNVSIAGTLTYEDVTNVDSIGVITARSGIVVGAGISAVGIVTANAFVGSGNNLTALNANNLSSGVVPDARFPATLPAVSGANLTSLNASELSSGTVPDGRFPATLPTISGENLTNVNAVFATKAGIATYTSSWAVTANGSSAYRFSGPGNLSTQDDPTIYLVRGQQYEFDLNVSGHPFLIRVSSGGSQYTDGVTTVGNNQTGKIRFDVPMDAPSELFYQCQYHSGMFGKFEITDGSKIVQGNSKVEVVDTGSNGYVKVETEGTERLRINSSGHVVPGTDSQYDIGTNTVRFANIYGDVLYGDGSNLTGITAGGVGAIGGLTIKSETGAVVGTAGSVATIDFNNSTGVTVTASSGAAGIASVVIAGVGTDTSINTTGIITATFSGDGQDLDKVSIGSTDGNFIGKGYLQAQKTVNAGGDRGDANIILGRFAGCCHDGGSYNVYLGDQAGRKGTGQNTDRNVFIGCQAGCGNTTGYHNVFLGSETGKGICGDSGSMNLFAGLQAGMRNTGCYNIAFGKAAYGRETGTKNIAIGFGAATDVGAGGTSNVFIGEYAGNNAQVNGPPCRGGISNVYVGTHAGYQNPGDFNIGIGDNSLNGNSSVSAGCRNIALGQCSGNDIQSGVDNIMLGSCAGAKITTGGCNILLGYNAGCNATGSFRNVYVGTNIGKTVCGGAYDISLGSSNLCETKWACNNIAIGKNIFQKANCYGASADALFNIGIGDAVGTGLTTGGYNVMLGYQGGYCLTCGSGNIIFGKMAGRRVSESTNNIFIGCYAGRSTVSAGCAGQANIAIGNLAGSQVSSTSDRNIFIGSRSGAESTGGCFNIALGADAATYLTGDRNIFIGQYSGFTQNVSGDKNVVIGDAVCLLSATGSTQLVIGAGATHWIDGDSSFNVTLAGVATATKSTGVFEATKFCGDGSCLTNLPSAGFEADAQGNLFASNTCSGCNFSGTNATDNILLGCCAGKCLTTGDKNIAIGCAALAAATVTGDQNIAIGEGSSKNITSGSNNIALGTNSLQCCMSTGLNNIAIGNQAGRKLQNNCNIAIGFGALCGSGGGIGSGNIAIGRRAGQKLTNGHHNIFMGDCAGLHITGSGAADGSYNIGFGREALGGSADGSSTSGNFNAVMGHYSGRKISSGSNNVLMGRNTGCSITSGGSNTFLGLGSGKCVTTGSQNIAIGVNVTPPSDTGSCQLVIGVESSHWMVGNSDFNVGIGTTNPNAAVGVGNTNKLSVGILSAYQLYGDGSCLTGTGGFNADAQVNLFSNNTCSGCNLDGTACNNIFLGGCAGKAVTSGHNNVILGSCAGAAICSGRRNILIGQCSGFGLTTAVRNVIIGCSGKTLTTGPSNVWIGMGIGDGGTAGNTNESVVIGHYAGHKITNAHYNLFLGAQTGYNNTSGCRNIFIGHRSVYCNSTGHFNIALGSCMELPITSGSNQLAIGCVDKYWIVGNCDFNVGIGTTNPKTDFQVGSHYGVVGGGGTFTAAAGVAHTINEYTIASTDFKTAEYTIFANTGNKIQSQKLLVMQDGTTAYSQEYAVMSSDTLLVSAGANIASGVVKIEVTPETGVSGLTTFRFTRHTML